MGGRAFLSGPNPLNVVRLSTDQYVKFRDQWHNILLKFYNRVVVPPEAPEKDDHGDIDALVDEALFKFTSQDLQKALGADAYIRAGRTTSFAIRLAENGSDFFQLDVGTCKKGCLEWESLIYAYGDLWHIIGSTVTRFDLAINDCGLHARVKESNSKDSLLHLTSNPQKMMDLLGLDVSRYDEGFFTLDELFEWTTSTPLFRRRIFEKETNSEKQGRMREKRPMYSKFVTEGLPRKMPSHTSTAAPEGLTQDKDKPEILVSAGSSISATAQYMGDEHAEEGNPAIFSMNERKDVLNEALLRFNKREQYQRLLEDHRKRALKDAMWKEIARTLPLQDRALGRAIVALKALLWWNDGQPQLKVKADRSFEGVPALEADTVDGLLLPWVKEHWREAIKLNEGNYQPSGAIRR